MTRRSVNDPLIEVNSTLAAALPSVVLAIGS
jgi:hypothetical protein